MWKRHSHAGTYPYGDAHPNGNTNSYARTHPYGDAHSNGNADSDA